MQRGIFQPDYVLLDAARLGDELDAVLESNKNHVNLYQGSSALTLSRYAPYLFLYEEDSAFSSKILKEGWGQSWGIMVNAAQPQQVLRAHFRKFLIVLNHKMEELYFRFYDPRVLRVFLPTCDGDQLKEFFGPVRQFTCEDKDPDYALLFSLEDGALITERKRFIDLFSKPVKKEVWVSKTLEFELAEQDNTSSTSQYSYNSETAKRAPRRYFD